MPRVMPSGMSFTDRAAEAGACPDSTDSTTHSSSISNLLRTRYRGTRHPQVPRGFDMDERSVVESVEAGQAPPIPQPTVRPYRTSCGQDTGGLGTIKSPYRG